VPVPSFATVAEIQEKEFLVACLCADWCDICTAYRDSFLALSAAYDGAAFTWVDIEDEAERIDDYEVENFPTVLIQRGALVLFYGVLPPPYATHLKRLLDEFLAQTPEQSAADAQSSAEQRGWQKERNLRALLAAANRGKSK